MSGVDEMYIPTYRMYTVEHVYDRVATLAALATPATSTTLATPATPAAGWTARRILRPGF